MHTKHTLVALLLALITAMMATGCQSKLIYLPRDYPPGVPAQWSAETGGKILNYRTGQGAQQAYLIGNRDHPERLWVVCGGNATLALEWSGRKAGGPRRKEGAS